MACSFLVRFSASSQGWRSEDDVEGSTQPDLRVEEVTTVHDLFDYRIQIGSFHSLNIINRVGSSSESWTQISAQNEKPETNSSSQSM